MNLFDFIKAVEEEIRTSETEEIENCRWGFQFSGSNPSVQHLEGTISEYKGKFFVLIDGDLYTDGNLPSEKCVRDYIFRNRKY